MTSTKHDRSVDRVAEAINNINCDIVINLQGDEPMVNQNDNLKSIDYKKKYPNSVINSYCYLADDEEPENKNIPKVITNEKDDLIYISRAPIPRLKNNNLISIKYKKQVCIYSYFMDELKSFL